MDNARNDLIARLIAPGLVGPMDPASASTLIYQVENNATRTALHLVLSRAASTGSCSFREMEELLGREATAPYRPEPEPLPAWEIAPEKEGNGDG